MAKKLATNWLQDKGGGGLVFQDRYRLDRLALTQALDDPRILLRIFLRKLLPSKQTWVSLFRRCNCWKVIRYDIDAILLGWHDSFGLENKNGKGYKNAEEVTYFLPLAKWSFL